MPEEASPGARRKVGVGPLVAGLGGLGVLAVLAGTVPSDVHAQACPPYCGTPIVTPAWHIHMCDVPYQEQLDDNRCMHGPGMTEFAAGTDRVWIIYCHKYTDTVVIQIRDSGGGVQFVNHPDGMTYEGEGCESIPFSRPAGIAPAGSPYRTYANWPEGPFSGVSPGVEWYIGLFVAFDADVYYGNDAKAEITARDPAANTSLTVIDEITVQVTSDSDPVGISVVLAEEAPSFPIFKTRLPIGFSQFASDQARGIIKVANGDTIKVSYCPRNCTNPWVDTAVWYGLSSTITPTPLPTWSGPPPTATPTPPPHLEVENVVIAPRPADVGYGPQITNAGRANHLGYPDMFVGMWTGGRNHHFGLVQFDLTPLPASATVLSARLELVGRSRRFATPGQWSVKLLGAAIDAGWREADYAAYAAAPVLGQVGSVLQEFDLADGRKNTFGFSPGQLSLLDQRIATTRRISFRVDGPAGESNNLFAWETGVDVYGRASSPPNPDLGPSLHISYVAQGEGPPPPTPGGGGSPAPTATGPTPTLGPGVTPSVSPSPTLGGGPTVTVGATTPGTPATLPPGVTPSPGTPVAATNTPGVGPTPTDHTPGTPATPGDPPTPGLGETPPATGSPGEDPTPTASPEGPRVGRQVCVLAFVDTDDDGLRTHPERLLPGATIRVTHGPSGAFLTWTTDGANEPDHCWAGLADGTYTIRLLDLPSGYFPSGLVERGFEVPFPGDYIQYEFGARLGPRPSATPAPSTTPTPSATPTTRPTPTGQPTVTGPAGDVCLAVYWDRGGDGFRDPGDVFLADVALSILDEARSPVRALSSTAEGATCARLAVGVYYAQAEVAPGFMPTTAQEQALLLTQGDAVRVEFGQRRPERGAALHLPQLQTRRR